MRLIFTSHCYSYYPSYWLVHDGGDDEGAIMYANGLCDDCANVRVR